LVSQDVNMYYAYMNPGADDAIFSGRSRTWGSARIRSRVLAPLWKIALMAVVPIFILLVFSGINAQSEYELQNLRSEVISLSKENATFRLEVAKLEAPARIQKVAVTELGMRVPEGVVYGRSDRKTSGQRITD